MESAQGLKSVRINILLTEALEEKLTRAAINLGISKAAYVRYALEKAFSLEEQHSLQKAVRELAHLYETDQELIAFTDLDSEDFS
jgi:predicted DNA-binding protein